MSEQIQIKIKCQKCHEVLAPNASFCHSCGFKRGGVSVCASCNTSLEPDWSVCPNCGKALNEDKKRELAAEQQRETTYTDSSTGMQFVWVPGGCYMMGDVLNDKDAFEDERPAHEVCVDGFWMGKYQVTQKQWTEVMGNNPSHFSSCGDNCPVESVSWDDVQDFIGKLNSQSGRSYRLPTEAEWEYAARSGGKSEKYSGGENVDAVAWYDGNAGGKTHRVGTKQRNGLGIYDMTGNVWEWCGDWYGASAYADDAFKGKSRNPHGPSGGSGRVGRGGSWLNHARNARASYRGGGAPGDRSHDLGFRVLLPPVQ